MDLSVSALIAAVLWADGVERVSAGALIVRRVLLGPWHLEVVERTGTRATSWWPPFSLTLVLAPPSQDGADGGAHAGSPDFTCRLSRITTALRVLRVLGAAQMGCLVFGVPLAAQYSGAAGFASAGLALLLLGLTCAVVMSGVLRAVGVGRRTALAQSFRVVWPFSTPGAAERVLRLLASDVAASAVVVTLLEETELARCLRPFAFDTLAGRGPEGHDPGAVGREALSRLVGRNSLAAIVAAPPRLSAADGAYCPRCSTEYQRSVERCADCGGVQLVRADAGGPARQSSADVEAAVARALGAAEGTA